MTEADSASSDVGRTRLLIEGLREVESEMERIRNEVARLSSLIKELHSAQKASQAELRRHQQRLDLLRLDRQIRALPAWLLARLRDDGEAEGD